MKGGQNEYPEVHKARNAPKMAKNTKKPPSWKVGWTLLKIM